MARQNLTEAGAQTKILEASKDGSFLVQVISPGWGSSGYYSSAVLEAAGKAKVWPAGTHLYFDHPSASEGVDRPERSVKDLAATLAEDARWDSARGSLVARVTPVGLGKTVLADEAFRKAVGVSVRAAADIGIGEAEGRKGAIVQEIFPDTFNSVDFVTHAGRGGMVLESARAAQDQDVPAAFLRESAIAKIREARNIGQWIESRIHLELTQLADNMFGDGRLTREERIALSSAVGDALQAFVADLEKSAPQLYTRDLWAEPDALAMAAEESRPAREAATADTEQALDNAVSQAYADSANDTYAWVRDFDPDAKLAYFELSADGVCTTYEQAYTVADSGEVELTGDRVEVTRRTTYVPVATTESAPPVVPVTHPAGQSTTTRENTMPENEGATTSIQESERRELEEKAGRVPVLEAKLASETERANAAEQALAVEKARDYARDFGAKQVREANSELDPAAVDRIVAEAMRELPLTEAEKAADRRLDTEAFGKRVTEAQQAEETYLATVIKNRGGSVQGLGQTEGGAQVTEGQVDNIIAGAFGRTVKGA
ncbi:MAG TPA: hypothetical protein VGH54_09570 [Mycobacterium sp.]|jgi:hypothetical protein|uniref:hypothetical protein n=1 Tax=Mycobacterium sp. TaxID=1785 RepID=UPI002F406572